MQRLPGAAAAQRQGASVATYVDESGRTHAVALYAAPFRVELYVDGAAGPEAPVQLPSIVVNSRGLSYFEHRRLKGDASQVAADTATAAAAGAAGHGGRKILDWGEDGKPIYEGDEEGAEGEGSAESQDSAAAGGDHNAAAHGAGEATRYRMDRVGVCMHVGGQAS
jgi:hypothetical protein